MDGRSDPCRNTIPAACGLIVEIGHLSDLKLPDVLSNAQILRIGFKDRQTGARSRVSGSQCTRRTSADTWPSPDNAINVGASGRDDAGSCGSVVLRMRERLPEPAARRRALLVRHLSPEALRQILAGLLRPLLTLFVGRRGLRELLDQ